MHSTDPADLSPLSFGTGLALGLMLVIGLPRADPVTAARGQIDRPARDNDSAIRDSIATDVPAFSATHEHRPITIDAHR